jgi:hypothetical protein
MRRETRGVRLCICILNHQRWHDESTTRLSGRFPSVLFPFEYKSYIWTLGSEIPPDAAQSTRDRGMIHFWMCCADVCQVSQLMSAITVWGHEMLSCYVISRRKYHGFLLEYGCVTHLLQIMWKFTLRGDSRRSEQIRGARRRQLLLLPLEHTISNEKQLTW